MSKFDMLGRIQCALVGVPEERLGVILDVTNKVSGHEGEQWKARVAVTLREGLDPIVVPPKPPVYLRQLFVGETILLNPTDGTRTITQAEEVFPRGIARDFVNWDIGVPAQPTGPMPVGVHEMVKDGTFRQIYASLDCPLHSLCLTQHQITDFCVKHRDKLRGDGYGTFFLLKKEGEPDDQDGDENNIEANLFVAYVDLDSDGRLSADVRRFSYGHVWSAECRRRFALPQLVPSSTSAS